MSEVDVVPQLGKLLVLMHEVGNQLRESKDPFMRRWGDHLVNDWRCLELVELKHQEPVEW